MKSCILFYLQLKIKSRLFRAILTFRGRVHGKQWLSVYTPPESKAKSRPNSDKNYGESRDYGLPTFWWIKLDFKNLVHQSLKIAKEGGKLVGTTKFMIICFYEAFLSGSCAAVKEIYVALTGGHLQWKTVFSGPFRSGPGAKWQTHTYRMHFHHLIFYPPLSSSCIKGTSRVLVPVPFKV